MQFFVKYKTDSIPRDNKIGVIGTSKKACETLEKFAEAHRYHVADASRE